MSKALQPLPIDVLIPEIQGALHLGLDLIVKASPGSGKTTRIPPALLDTFKGQIWVLEPRRVATRLSAQRVADELNETPGVTVGWHMRFDRQFTDKTRILFLTEGMFTSRLAQNPNLDGVDCVIIDEFHERHQQTDVAFALCLNLQKTSRKNLRVVVMSATLDTASIAEKMPTAKIIDLDLPLFPVNVKHQFFDSDLSLSERAALATASLTREATNLGHILVFLPGTYEMLKTRRELERTINLEDWIIFELRATLDKKTQDLAFRQTDRRKIILATNIAESSITIPQVTAVIDSGIAKVPSYNPFTGFSILETRPISKASIIQRAGRAGRTAPGTAIRLFTKNDEAARPDQETPELLRLDLSQIYMSLLWLGHRQGIPINPEDLPWPSPPELQKWDDARKLLVLLDIIDREQKLIRPDVAKMPLHPRLARFASACIESGITSEAPWLTAILASEGDIAAPPGESSHLGCDLLASFEYLKSKSRSFENIDKLALQISKYLELDRHSTLEECKPAHELDLSKPLLRAFPDRVIMTRRRTSHSNWIDGTICTGGDVLVASDSAAAHGQWLVAIAASAARSTGSLVKSGDQSSTSKITVKMASMIEPMDLPQGEGSLFSSEVISTWDANIGRTRQIKKDCYGILTISETTLSVNDSPDERDASEKIKILAESIRLQWARLFDDSDFLDSYVIRQKIAFERQMINHCWQKQELLDLLIAFICDSASSLEDIKRHTLEEWLRYCVGEQEFQQLEKVAPTHVLVGRNYKVKVHYPENAAPWIEARLQNFFGESKTPKILNNTLSLTLHLLAPNMRALQVTNDLESFWKGAYQTIRNEYQRKYPRHQWPEDPINAEPPVQRQPRNRK